MPAVNNSLLIVNNFLTQNRRFPPSEGMFWWLETEKRILEFPPATRFVVMEKVERQREKNSFLLAGKKFKFLAHAKGNC
jgi:hypothetical protein